jgi:hypothetical protein
MAPSDCCTRASILALALTAASCGTANPTSSTDTLLPVVAITTVDLNPFYPERRPTQFLNSPICQIDLDVDTIVPNACTGFGHHSDLVREGNTFHFEVHPSPGATRTTCGGPVHSSFGLCVPGMGADPPPPALPRGHYVVIVNGFAGGFDIP